MTLSLLLPNDWNTHTRRNWKRHEAAIIGPFGDACAALKAFPKGKGRRNTWSSHTILAHKTLLRDAHALAQQATQIVQAMLPTDWPHATWQLRITQNATTMVFAPKGTRTRGYTLPMGRVGMAWLLGFISGVAYGHTQPTPADDALWGEIAPPAQAAKPLLIWSPYKRSFLDVQAPTPHTATVWGVLEGQILSAHNPWPTTPEAAFAQGVQAAHHAYKIPPVWFGGLSFWSTIFTTKTPEARTLPLVQAAHKKLMATNTEEPRTALRNTTIGMAHMAALVKAAGKPRPTRPWYVSMPRQDQPPRIVASPAWNEASAMLGVALRIWNRSGHSLPLHHWTAFEPKPTKKASITTTLPGRHR